MISKSRYLTYFNENAAKLKECFELVGDVLLLEKIKFPEQKTASGLILAQHNPNQLGTLTADRPCFYRVLLPGEGYFDSTLPEGEKDIPLNTKSGDIIMVGAISVKLFSSFPLLDSYEPDSVGITRESDVQWRFKGEDAFTGFLAELNAAATPAPQAI